MVRHIVSPARVAAAILVGSVAVAGSASGSTISNLVIDTWSAVPGTVNGEAWPKNSFDNPKIDNAGNIIFGGFMDINGPGGVTTANRRGAWWAPNDGSPIQMIARDGSTATTLPNVNGWRLNSTSNGTGLSSGPVLAPNGTLFLSGQLNGTGATTTNNTSFWTGKFGNIQQVAQRGFLPGPNGVAPGTAGALWNTNLNISPTQQGINNNGQLLMFSSLTGGDVSGTTNNSGLWLAGPSGITMVMRKGQSAPGLGDPTITMADAPQFGLYINGSAETAFVNKLTIGTGVTPVVATNANVMWSTIGGSLAPIARQGDVIPGMPGVRYSDASSASPFTNYSAGITNNHSVIFNSSLAGAVTAGVNDTALFKYNGGTVTKLLQRGDALPLANCYYNLVNGGNTKLNSFDDMLLPMSMTGSGVTSGINDQALFLRKADGTMQLIVREGDLVGLPELPADATFSDTAFTSEAGMGLNALDQVVFYTRISGTGIVPGVNDSCVFAWDPNLGMMLVAQAGMTFDYPNLAALTQVTIDSRFNGESGCSGFSDTGWLTWRGSDQFGNQAIFRTLIPEPGSLALVALGVAALGLRRR